MRIIVVTAESCHISSGQGGMIALTRGMAQEAAPASYITGQVVAVDGGCTH